MRRRKTARPATATAAAVNGPDVKVSAGQRKLHGVDNPSGPSAQAGFLAVYDEQICLGYLLSRGKQGIEAFDCDDRLLGIFATQRDAANALELIAGKRRRGGRHG